MERWRMIRRWWKRYLSGVGAGPHLERCPFCGETFDIRDSCQVLVHYNHQVTAGAPTAIDPTREEGEPPSVGKVVPLRRRREG
jgi:hypothetical protein